MATTAYFNWVSRGEPYQLATPVAELQALARRHGVAVLGTIGNNDHLTASRPEDHTPFSTTEYPVALNDYIVTAIDLADGPHADRMLADARAGRAPWIKYVNFRGGHYSIKTGWQRESSGDSHFHLSIMTTWATRSIGTYDPFNGGTTTMSELSPDDLLQLRNLHTILVRLASGESGNINYNVTSSPVAKWWRDSAEGVATLIARPPVIVDPVALANALVANPAFFTNLAAAITDRPFTGAQLQQIEDAAYRGANRAEDS